MTDGTGGTDEAETRNEIETELSRDMGLFDITFIGVGAMIGAGVFALTGFAAGLAGPALTLAFLLNGIIAMFTAVSYAELGAAFPEAGGGYLWVKEALVDPNGFFAGWMSWFAHAVACSLYAITFGVFLTELAIFGVPGLQPDFVYLGVVDRLLVDKVLAVLMVLAFAYINYRGAEETGKAGIVVTGIKVLILGIFIVFGIKATLASPGWPAKFLENPSFMPNGLFGVVGAMGLTYIAFEGYEIIVQSGEEVVDPGRNIPRAVFISMAIVVPIYILVAFAAIGGIEATPALIERATGIAGDAGSVPTWELLGGLGELGIIHAAGQFVPYGVPLLLIAGLTATMSALNATIYSSSRVSFAMGRDRSLPGIFDRVHDVRRTPHVAIALSAVLIAIMAVSIPIESVAASADIMFILLFVQVNWTLIRMRQTHPDLPRTYRVPFMPWPPLIGLVLQFLLTPILIYELGLEAMGIGSGNEGLVALIATGLWMGLGLVIYIGYSRQQEVEKREEETPTVVVEREPADRPYRLLVPVANPETVPQLMRTAIDIARDHEGEILVMNVIELPQQTPLPEGRRFVEERRPVIDEATSMGRAADVPVSGRILIGHDASKAILNTIDAHDVDAVLLGWRGRPRRRDFAFGSNVDRVILRSSCDVLVERIGSTPSEVERILVPTAGGPHAAFAGEIAGSIAGANDAAVDVVTVVDPDADESDLEAATSRVAAVVEKLEGAINGSVQGDVLKGEDVVGTIVERSSGYDLVVLGATREGLFQQLLFGAIPEEVGRRAETTVIMAKRHLGIGSRLRRWFRGAR